MKTISAGELTVLLNEETLSVTVRHKHAEWSTLDGFIPVLQCKEGTFPFTSAASVSHELFKTGVGTGIRSTFSGFCGTPYTFETLIWIEQTTEDVRFEWLPVTEDDLCVEKVFWPGEFSFETPSKNWYTVLTTGQGLLVPNTWETPLSRFRSTDFSKPPAATCRGLAR